MVSCDSTVLTRMSVTCQNQVLRPSVRSPQRGIQISLSLHDLQHEFVRLVVDFYSTEFQGKGIKFYVFFVFMVKDIPVLSISHTVSIGDLADRLLSS